MSRLCENWLKAYLRYACPVSEMEERGHRWIALSTLAACLGRRVWIDQVTFKWFPNLFVVIVSEAGMAKTTTLDIGADLIQGLKRTEDAPGVVFGPQKSTFQAIVNKFIKIAAHQYTVNGKKEIESPLHFSVSEWSTLIPKGDAEFQDLLINWWDGKPGDRSTLWRGDEMPINPIINMVGCTTLSTFNEMFTARSMEGGFLSRCVIVRCNKSRNIAYPATAALEHAHWRDPYRDNLIADLRHINQLTGAYTLSPEAVEWGTAWYEEFKNSHIATLPDYMVAWATRKQTYLHKIALLNRISKDDTKIITAEDLQEALTWMNDIEVSAQEVMGRIGMKEMADVGHKVVGLVKRYSKTPGCAPEDIIRNRTWGFVQTPYDWDQLIRGMTEANMILRYKNNLILPEKAIDMGLDRDKVKQESLQLLRRVI